MDSIKKYKKLIQALPVKKQASLIKKEVWKKRFREKLSPIVSVLFSKNDEIVISREDILKENDCRKKIIMILMWGYPTGGRGNHIQDALESIDGLCENLFKIKDKSLTKDKAKNLIQQFDCIKGLGPSTWSKLLYFFNISVDFRKCQIFDIKIVNSLNKIQFKEFNRTDWNQQNIDDYFEYLELTNSLSQKLNASPDQLENFLFHYNLGYKF